MRQPINTSSRVPRYQNIEIIDGVLRLFVCILPLRGGLGGANISLLLSLCQSARLCRLLPTGRKKVREKSLGSFSAPERSALPLSTEGTKE